MDSLPENGFIALKSDFNLLELASLDSVAGFATMDIGTRPGRKAPLFNVLGVANDALKVLALGVVPKRDAELLGLAGDPLADTFVGEAGLRAGDCNSEVLNGEALEAGGGTASLKGDPSIEFPSNISFLFGGDFIEPLNGDCGGLRAGLAIREPVKSVLDDVVILFTTIEDVKSSFFAVPNKAADDFAGLFISNFIGVFSIVANSSSEPRSFAVDI